MSDNLTPRQDRFVQEYLLDLNGTQAAIRAGYSERTANEQAARLLANVSVRSAIEKAKAERCERTKIDQDRIVRELLNVVTADANELIEYRRTCCRYCYGKKFRFQRTAAEMVRAEAEFEKRLEEAKNDDERQKLGTFDPQGGIGYDPRKAPRQDCPECFGEGEGTAFAKDTRKLSASAKALYAGVKITKEGLEIKMHDKQGHMQLLMRHAGMLRDKVELGGPDGGPVQFQEIRRVIVSPKS